LQHPTYKAFAELGKAIKTIFLCQYLHSEALSREIHDGPTLQNGKSSVQGLRQCVIRLFDQGPKSLSILPVIDDPVLRQAIEKQLDRIEHVHRFTRAVSVGNPREFLQADLCWNLTTLVYFIIGVCQQLHSLFTVINISCLTLFFEPDPPLTDMSLLFAGNSICTFFPSEDRNNKSALQRSNYFDLFDLSLFVCFPQLSL
jgi:hypothetical protein